MSKYSVGLRNVGSYQASCTPWITASSITAGAVSIAASQVKIEFPYVTKRVTVYHVHSQTSAKRIRVAFQSASAGFVHDRFHYTRLFGSYQQLDMDVKCKEIYLYNDAVGQGINNIYIYAELTNIPTTSMHHLTGSGITE